MSSSASSGQQVYPPAASFPSTSRPSEPFRYHSHLLIILLFVWHHLTRGALIALFSVLRSAAMAQQMVPVTHSAGQMLAQMSRQSTPSGVTASNNNSPIQAPAGPTVPPGVWSATRPPFNTQVDI